MGVVYLARDERLDRDVAIKCLPDELAHDPDRLERMRREAKVLASLNHPHIATIHGLESVDGRLYLVLEHVGGESLREHLDSRGRSWRTVVEVAASLADALSAAHDRGIVHRDLKPDNVRFTSDGVVKLLDFGLACDASKPAGSEAVTREIRPSALVGTPGYMAPEQVRGEPADERSDIFALGCLLHEMLTGQPTFARGSVAESMASTLQDVPDPPARSGAQVPLDLDPIVMRCLEKRPGDRFQSARDLAFALRGVPGEPANGEAVALPSRPGTARWIWSAVAAALVLLAGTWLLRNAVGPVPAPAAPDEAPRVAVLPFEYDEALAGKAYLARSIPESIIDGLSPISGLHVVPSSTSSRYGDWDGGIVELGTTLKADAVVTGRIQSREGSFYVRAELVDVETGRQLWGQRFDQSLDDPLAVERELTRRIVDVLKLELTGADEQRLAGRHPNNAAAFSLYLEARSEAFRRDAPGLHRAISLYDEAIELEPTYALAHAGKADAFCMLGLGLAEPAADVMPKAKAAASRALDHGPMLAEVHAALGLIHWLWDWDYERAEQEYRQATELNPRYAEAYHFLAHVLASRGRLAEAVATSKQSGGLAPDKAVFGSCLGHFHAWNGKPGLALAQLEDVVVTHPRFGLARVYLGREYVAAEYVPHIAFARIHAGLGEPDDAIAALRRAVQARESVLPLIRCEPHFRILEGDPRFLEILRDIRLAD
jgi:serine/threonine-protein kinase